MDRFLDELRKIRAEHEGEFPGLAMEYSPELMDRIVAYVRQEQQRGQTVLASSKRLGIEVSRLRHWNYHPRRYGKELGDPLTGGLRPVQVTGTDVVVADGVPERRFTVSSPAGWKVSDLTLCELTELVRSLV